MRDIEFRGKRIDNSEWHFGDLMHAYGQTFIGKDCEDHRVKSNPGAALLKELEQLRRVRDAAKDIVKFEHTNLHKLKQALADLEKEE